MLCLRIEFKSVVLRYQFEAKYLLKKGEQRKVRVMNVEKNLGSCGCRIFYKHHFEIGLIIIRWFQHISFPL